MAQAMAGKLLKSRWNSDKLVRLSDEASSFADSFLGFLEEQEESPKSSCDSTDYIEDDHSSSNVEGNKKFWETQNELLQATLYRTSSLETTIRQATKAAVKEIKLIGLRCNCYKVVTEECRNCLQREISLRLQAQGYNCAICKSKWKSSQEIPSGEHTYLEVVEKNRFKKGEVRLVIELNFRGEFEMARASEEYNGLINRLPEIFVGKEERLRALIKILCSAGKKCMKEKNMHLGPWRKSKYMQSKWLGTCERTTLFPPLPVGFSDRPAKPKASLLTYDLLEINMPVLHRTAVQVL